MGKGRITVTKDGKLHVHKDGKFDLTTDDTSKGTCCCCKPYELARFVTSNSETWYLSQYQGVGVAAPNRYWRLINDYTRYVPIQRGCVDKNGKLLGLPNSISPTSYKYTWTFRLEIGCKDGSVIRYPSGTDSVILLY